MNEQTVKLESEMKKWLQENRISYRRLAAEMGQSASGLCKKVNGETAWQQSDLIFLHAEYGLSSDFVLGISGRGTE